METSGNPAGLSTGIVKAGCCGIVGPVPPPLWIRPQILRPKLAISIVLCQSADQAVSRHPEYLTEDAWSDEFLRLAVSLARGGAWVL
jgi:hypothetical protein